MRFEVGIPPFKVAAVLLLVLGGIAAVDYGTNRLEWDRFRDLQYGYCEVEFPDATNADGSLLCPKRPNSFSRTFELVRLRFDTDREANIPTWYSSFVLALAGVVLAAVAGREGALGRKSPLPWAALALIFLYLSLDEVAQIHELLGGEGSIGHDLNEQLGLTFVRFDWVVPAAIAVILVLPFFVPFMLRLPLNTFLLFALGGSVFLGGAVGMETVTSRYAFNTMDYHIANLVEESLEPAGVTVFILGILLYARDNLRNAPALPYTLGQSFLLPFRRLTRRSAAARGRPSTR